MSRYVCDRQRKPQKKKSRGDGDKPPRVHSTVMTMREAAKVIAALTAFFGALAVLMETMHHAPI